MRKETFPKQCFSYIDLNKYLKTLPGEGIFYFNIKQTKIEYLLDHPHWRDFFYDENTQICKETD